MTTTSSIAVRMMLPGAFEGERRAGATVDQAQEVAMKILMDGVDL